MTLEQAVDGSVQEYLLQSFICIKMDETVLGPCSKANGARSSPDRRPRTKAARRQRAGWPWNFGSHVPAHSWIANLAREDSALEEKSLMSAPVRVCAGMAAQERRLAHKAGFDVLQAGGAGRSGRCLDPEIPLQAVDDPSARPRREGMGGKQGRPAVFGKAI